MTKRIMKWDEENGMMECPKCGAETFPHHRPGINKFKRGAWQCPEGCGRE